MNIILTQYHHVLLICRKQTLTIYCKLHLTNTDISINLDRLQVFEYSNERPS